MRDTRDRLLDAVETLLIESGPGSTTLEAVAAEAGVSKGGLLYHFGSKRDLFTGLLDRLNDVGEQDFAALRAAPRGAVAGFLESSRVADDGFTRTLLAATRLIGVREVDAAAALTASIDAWAGVIADQVSDPVLARLVQLVGDGLYLHALLGADSEPLDSAVVERVIALVPAAGDGPDA
ncbi:transcriptional regulator, TetR family [Beutenbergia cavernae DSM 12333]|uniref:Transcriptional regulator, TetR family n=1 Tax=Beutenbergia cavernae (strain ATCC BAA-8 / DSM 12333 / CCUG 43141 / JCM 11478 / NBRC 16432 / NCIMB 13614 / HKI 0122) TaxID=471853 RepID=C5C224_BEUC1|nr:TetR/AcrR family transcriptional regulator [Beutenbergia cavernae]ACQ81649.1 transcriptional regulator, TetR family [Beutenbergia cavernae DSM 12333]